MLLYRGIRIASPEGLCVYSAYQKGELTRIHKAEINPDHPLTDWIVNDCEGPWRVGIYRPYRNRKMYVAFARSADAMLFCLHRT